VIPKVSKATASEPIAMDGFEGHYDKLEGGYTVGFESYHEESDLAERAAGVDV
jgi:hypothetical protein